MKNTNLETYGNNYPTDKIKRIQVPLFTQENNTLQSGLKYFFPENPDNLLCGCTKTTAAFTTEWGDKVIADTGFRLCQF